jgi:hypothetical protein
MKIPGKVRVVLEWIILDGEVKQELEWVNRGEIRNEIDFDRKLIRPGLKNKTRQLI